MLKENCVNCNSSNLKILMFKINSYRICGKCYNLFKKNNCYISKCSVQEIQQSISENISISLIRERKYIEEKQNKFKNLLNGIIIKNPRKSDIKTTRLLLKDMPEYKFSSIRKNSNNIGNFISLDTETTGLSPGRNKLIEISLIKFQNFKPVDCLTTLLHIKEDLPEKIIKITNITNDMLETAPNVQDVMIEFYNFIKGYDIIGYNLEFDLKFLYANGLNFFDEKRKFYDILEIARKKIKKSDIYDYKLTTVTEYFSIYPPAKHRATEDALCTGLLFDIFCNNSTIYNKNNFYSTLMEQHNDI